MESESDSKIIRPHRSILMKAPTTLTSILIIFQALTKGQLISERIYEVSPKIRTKNCQDFCPV